MNGLAATGYALVAAALAGLAWLRPATPPPATVAALPPSTTTPAVPAPASPAVGSAPERTRGNAAAPTTAPTSAGSRDLLLPDGSTVPALNGAVDAEPLATFWGPFPWSPIVGVERNDQGVDWYKHADGSYSTTQMVWRPDLGRHAAMTRVAHPGATPPAPRR
ncbi:MAG: hypothetical protein ACK5BN_05010 [Planctomycetota bacterium]